VGSVTDAEIAASLLVECGPSEASRDSRFQRACGNWPRIVGDNPGDNGEGTPVSISLRFDASRALHRFAIEWIPCEIDGSSMAIGHRHATVSPHRDRKPWPHQQAFAPTVLVSGDDCLPQKI